MPNGDTDMTNEATDKPNEATDKPYEPTCMSNTQRLRLLESVVTHTNDAIVVTEASPQDEPGPRIVYVNDAFTRMTGYTSEEVIGRSPRFMQGPRSDMAALHELGKAMRVFKRCEIETINYKKSGEEFWINMSVDAVTVDSGACTHFISIQRDVTERKVRELKRALLADIAVIFYTGQTLRETLSQSLSVLAEYGQYDLAEIWLVTDAKDALSLSGFAERSPEVAEVYRTMGRNTTRVKGEGLPGLTWLTGEIQIWNIRDFEHPLLRQAAFRKAGILAVTSLPLIQNNTLIGVIVLGSKSRLDAMEPMRTFLDGFQAPFCAEIRRKQIELEQNRLFDFAPDAIVVADMNGYFRRVNGALAEMLGYTVEELLSRPFIDFVHPDDVAITVKALQGASQSETIFAFENRQITKSGEVRWIAWTASLITDGGFVQAVGKDITDKKKAEAEVLRAMKEKDSILDSIGDGFYAIDKDWNILFWNLSATRMLGHTRTDAVGRNLWDLFPGAVGSDFQSNYVEAMRTNLPVKFESCYTPTNRTYAVHVFPSDVGLSVYFTDITERVLSLKALEESEKRYSDIFHLSPVPMFIVDDATLTFLAVNQSALDNYQYTLEEFLTKGVRDLLPHETDDRYNAIIEKNRSEFDRDMHGPYVHSRKDGTTLLVEIRMHRFQYKNTDATIVIATDVTERSAYVSTIEAQNQTLRDITWMQSHLVRAPLSRIMSLVELAAAEYPDEYKKMSYMHHLLTSAKELDDIIREISDKANTL